MNVRLRFLSSFLVGGLVIASLLPATAAGQARTAVRAKTWAASLTPEGHPDLQVTWMNKSATPLERPLQLKGRPSLSDAEVAELQKRAHRLFADGRSDYIDGDDLLAAALGAVAPFQ